MTKYTITVEQVWSVTYEIEADDEEDALETFDFMDPGEFTDRQLEATQNIRINGTSVEGRD